MKRFPNEPKDYRRARDELLEAEVELRRQIEAVAEKRRALPLGGEATTDYAFDEWDPAVGDTRTVRLSELFGDKESLFVYSFMFKPGKRGEPLEVPCEICTSIIDAIDGAVPHLEQRIGFAVSAKAPVERLRAHALARGWQNVRLVSSGGSTYNTDYGAEDDGGQYAMATVFTRRGGKIHHTWSSELWFVPPEPGQNPRHVDFMWPMWAVFDRTPEGRGESWYPRLDYDG